MPTKVTTTQKQKRAEQTQIVVFNLDAEEYAVPIAMVREVIKIPEITAVPQSPDFISGIINLRGKVIVVINLEIRFGLTREDTDTAQENIIIVDLEESQFGVMVDGVTEVMRVSSAAVKPAPKTIESKIGKEFIQGVVVLAGQDVDVPEVTAASENTAVKERVLLVLDLKKVMSKAEQKKVKQITKVPVPDTALAESVVEHH